VALTAVFFAQRGGSPASGDLFFISAEAGFALPWQDQHTASAWRSPDRRNGQVRPVRGMNRLPVSGEDGEQTDDRGNDKKKLEVLARISHPVSHAFTDDALVLLLARGFPKQSAQRNAPSHVPKSTEWATRQSVSTSLSGSPIARHSSTRGH
jgi:hypothetical protein